MNAQLFVGAINSVLIAAFFFVLLAVALTLTAADFSRYLPNANLKKFYATLLIEVAVFIGLATFFLTGHQGDPKITNIQLVYHKSGLTQVTSFDYDANFKAGRYPFAAKVKNRAGVKEDLMSLADNADLQDGDIVKAHVNNMAPDLISGRQPKLIIDSLQRYQANGRLETLK